MGRLASGALLALLLAGGWSRPAAEVVTRALVPTGVRLGEPADWVSIDGGRIAFGRGRQVRLATGLETPVLERSLDAGVAVRDAVLVESTLYVNDGTRLGTLDLAEAAPTLRPLRLSPDPAGGLRTTRMTDYLVVAEDGVGLRLVALPPPAGMPMAMMSRFDHVMHPTQVALHPLRADFRGLAAAGAVVYALTGPGVVTVVDLGDPARPASRTLAVDPTARALAANGATLYVLADDGLTVFDLAGRGGAAVARHPGVSGSALQVAGRAIQVASGEGGLRTFVDHSPVAAIVDVTVGSNFFSPQDVSVGPGDTVRWTKSGGLHNVEGCSPGAGGGRCGTLTSTEVFRSGDATFDPFVYTHVFNLTGTHGYVCVVHGFAGTGMVGTVTVGGGPTCGDGNVDPLTEECDDGNVTSGDGCEADCTFTTSGEIADSLTLDKAPGGDITLAWGSSCLASDTLAGVYEGLIPAFQTYSMRTCDQAGGAATFLPPVDSAFYLVVPHNPSSEGSYGRDSAGTPRPTGAVTCRVQRLGSCP